MQPENHTGLMPSVTALLGSVMGYLRARLELAGIEGREAVALYLKIAILLVAALLLLAFGYAFLWIGALALLASVCTFHWAWLVLGIAVLHCAGVAACIWGVRRLWKKEVFSATLEEFRKDQQWLK